VTAKPMSDDDPLYSVPKAAEFLSCSKSTLERHRIAGTGPAFFKCGPGKRAKVLYARSALIAWLGQHRFGSTSEYPK
jgi:hypothetical protein